MKLYSWIYNERQVIKTQGGNKKLGITLDYEEEGRDWRCNTENHMLTIYYYLDENNTPTLSIKGSKAFKMVDNR